MVLEKIKQKFKKIIDKLKFSFIMEAIETKQKKQKRITDIQR